MNVSTAGLVLVLASVAGAETGVSVSPWSYSRDGRTIFGWTAHHCDGEARVLLPTSTPSVVGTRRAWFQASDGLTRVGGFQARDAGGVPVSASVEFGPTGVEVVVGPCAAPPLSIDPVFEPADFMMAGTEPDAMVGYAVAHVGDVNGDGFGDVAIAPVPQATDFRLEVQTPENSVNLFR